MKSQEQATRPALRCPRLFQYLMALEELLILKSRIPLRNRGP